MLGRPPEVRPGRTFALLAIAGVSLIGSIAWSTHHLLLAGAPVAAGGDWPGFACLLLPLGNDFAPHVASYAFLVAIGAGAWTGVASVLRQHRQTNTLLRTCLGAGMEAAPPLREATWRLGLQDRLDVVDVPAAVAFCYGYARPRVLVSGILVDALSEPELEALLLHEREHLRRRDPLKVAIGRLLASALFFVPALDAIYRRFLIEKELAADEAAVKSQGTAAELAAALVHLLETRPVPRHSFVAAGDEALDTRIDRLVGEPVRLGPNLGHLPLLGSGIVGLVAILPLVLTPLPETLVASAHNVVAGCHLLP